MKELSRKGWLSGWKEIAEYCGGVSCVTAKTYVGHGLPVHKIGGKIVALPLELDNWLLARPVYKRAI